MTKSYFLCLSTLDWKHFEFQRVWNASPCNRLEAVWEYSLFVVLQKSSVHLYDLQWNLPLRLTEGVLRRNWEPSWFLKKIKRVVGKSVYWEGDKWDRKRNFFMFSPPSYCPLSYLSMRLPLIFKNNISARQEWVRDLYQYLDQYSIDAKYNDKTYLSVV